MHHAEVVIGLLIWVWLLENPHKVVPKITHFEEPFYFIVIRHGLSFLVNRQLWRMV